MLETSARADDADDQDTLRNSMSRRELLVSTMAAGTVAIVGSHADAQERHDTVRPQKAAASGRGGLLYPQQNQQRNLLDTSGLWQFQLDPKEKGVAKDWFKALPAPRPISVPCSWNDKRSVTRREQFDDASLFVEN